MFDLYQHTKRRKITDGKPVKVTNSIISRNCGTKLQARRFKQHSSGLERLPPELLESIFFFSLNISLPRASPLLSTALSTEHIFKGYSARVLFSAFCYRGWEYPIENRSGWNEEDLASARSHALNCRWMTPERFDKLHSVFLEQEQERFNEDTQNKHKKVRRLLL